MGDIYEQILEDDLLDRAEKVIQELTESTGAIFNDKKKAEQIIVKAFKNL